MLPLGDAFLHCICIMLAIIGFCTSSRTMFDANKNSFRLTALGGVIVLLLAMAYLAWWSRWVAVAVLSVFLLLSLIVIFHRGTLPKLFELLFVSAALLNAFAYATGLLTNSARFDEIAHLYTSFAVTLAFGFIVYEALLRVMAAHRLLLMLTITCLGIAIGVGWELVEWAAQLLSGNNILRGVDDTITDLIFDATGAFVAALVIDHVVSVGNRKQTSE